MQLAKTAWPLSPAVWLAVVTLLGVCLLGWFSVLTRPVEAVAAVWWPAAGLSLGLAIRLPRRYLWLVSVAVSLVLLGVNLVQYPALPVAIGASIGAGLEVAVGAWILRGRSEAVPSLRTNADLFRLVVAVVVAATVYDWTLAFAAFASGDTSVALIHLFSAGPRRAAGMLMVTPLFMSLPKLERRRGVDHPAIQVGVAFVVTVLVFFVNDDSPLAFLGILPPVWGAIYLAPRWLVVEMLGISALASYGSTLGHGPFSFTRLGADTGGTLLQAFELTMAIVALAMSLAVARERDVSAKLGASELVFRRNFESSLTGMLVIDQPADGWRIQRFNASAAGMFPQLEEAAPTLAGIFGPDATGVIAAAADVGSDVQPNVEVKTDDERHFQIGVVPLELESETQSFSVQILDVTDSLRVQRQAAEELQRAAEVQRALTPAELPTRAGWEHGAFLQPAREVGGDFYDLRIEGRFAVMLLGDVMGKGVGAGILAAATRTALRTATPATRPSDALGDGARIIDDDLRRSNAFVTLGYATIDLHTGQLRLADAGHGLSFVLRHDGTDIQRLATDGLPLGLDSDWAEVSLELAPGDSLLMVSDGVLDRWGGSIPQLVTAIHTLRADLAVDSPQRLAESLCQGGGADADASDDATAVIFHRDRSTT
jgi:phosphoserine phosphatase RsbU/P